MSFDLKQIAVKSWKTTLAGLVAFLFTVPAFVNALEQWAHGQHVDWKTVLQAIAAAAVSGGLIAAKDSTVHSTLDEVENSSKSK